MSDIKLDLVTGDIVIEGGMQLTQNTLEEASQRLMTALNINLGEYFLDIRAGIPYLKANDDTTNQGVELFLGDKRGNTNKAFYIYNTLNFYIEGLSFIDKLLESNYTFDRSTRVFNYNYKVRVVDGTVIEFNTFSQTI